MRKYALSFLIVCMLLFVSVIPVMAVEIDSTLTNWDTPHWVTTGFGPGGIPLVTMQMGKTWEYSYTILNNDIKGGLYVFDIYFPSISGPDSLLYSKITETANPDSSNWSTQIFIPSAPDLGALYDAGTLTTPIALGDSLSGFSVSFEYSGTAASLGSQFFEIYDTSYDLIETGYTGLAGLTFVPIQGMFVLDPGTFAEIYDTNNNLIGTGYTNLEGSTFVVPVPEPSTLMLLVSGMLGLLGYSQWARKHG
jgi:hypothetical protein